MTRTSAGVTTGVVLLVLIGLACVPAIVEAADVASFESLYRKSSGLSSTDWAIAAGIAILGAAAVFFFAPAAGPVTASIGTWIGGLFGYSGVAATNFGLALLGGGAVAKGGFGIVGGVAVLTAALSFSTDVVIDYSAGKVIESYDYDEFAKASRQMTTLPLPRNDRGPRVYRQALAALAEVENEQPLSSEHNRRVVSDAIALINRAKVSGLDGDEIARVDTLLALLYFVSDDYLLAVDKAVSAHNAASAEGMISTVPAFIFATCLLYDEEINFDQSMEWFTYAISEEPDNPLSPLLFSVFMDRVMYRLNDDALTIEQMRKVAAVYEATDLQSQRTPVQIAMLSRHMLLLKLEQQKISSLAQSSSERIRRSEGTVTELRNSLDDYQLLLEGANFLAGALSTSDALSDESVPEELRNVRELMAQYSSDRFRLEGLVAELERYQQTPEIKGASTESPQGADFQMVKAMLDEAGIYYSVDEDGDFALVYAIDENRSQKIWIDVGRGEQSGDEQWFVFSYARVYKGVPPVEELLKLLKENSHAEWGSWQTDSSTDEVVILYGGYIGKNAVSGALVDILDMAVSNADSMERELSGADQW
jgi:hypothetical protein